MTNIKTFQTLNITKKPSFARVRQLCITEGQRPISDREKESNFPHGDYSEYKLW